MKNRVRVLRAEFRLSQADLAERLGVARQTVHAVENDKFAPSLTLAFKIASLFGSDINDVFAPDPEDLIPSLLDARDGSTSTRVTSADRAARSRPLVFFGKARTETE